MAEVEAAAAAESEEERAEVRIIADFSALLQPEGTHVKAYFSETGVRIVGSGLRSLEKEIHYDEIESWEEDAYKELFRFAARGKDLKLVTKDAAAMRDLVIPRVDTTIWQGEIGSVVESSADGSMFPVMKLPIGSQATVEFKSEHLVVTDRSQLGVKGGVAVREIPYGDMLTWSAGKGEWGFTARGDVSFAFVTDQVRPNSNPNPNLNPSPNPSPSPNPNPNTNLNSDGPGRPD